MKRPAAQIWKNEASVARPASYTNNVRPHGLNSLKEVHDWLSTFSAEAVNQHSPLARLHKAVDLLNRPPSREQRDAIRKILSSWGVKQKTQRKKRPVAQAKSDLEHKVFREAVRLKALAHTGAHTLSDLHAAFARASN